MNSSPSPALLEILKGSENPRYPLMLQDNEIFWSGYVGLGCYDTNKPNDFDLEYIKACLAFDILVVVGNRIVRKNKGLPYGTDFCFASKMAGIVTQ